LNYDQEEFRILFENVPAYIAVVDHGYRIAKANGNFKNTFGDRVGEPCYKIYKGLPEKCRECPVERAFLEGTLQVHEEIGRNKEGREVYYLVYAVPVHDPNGNIPYAIEMSIDLTERKNLEKALQASQEFLNNVIETSSHAIVAVDAMGRLVVFNRAAEILLGYAAPEVIGSPEVEKFFPRNFSRKILEAMSGELSKEGLKIMAQETFLPSKDGGRIPVLFSGLGLLKDGSILGAVGLSQDLRPIKALEREKLQAERLAAVGQTVAGLAHGIKNIMTGLEGGVYVVQTATKTQDKVLLHKGWEMIERNIAKVSTLVKDLLSYSRERAPELQWISPNDLAEEACFLFQEKARQGKIQLLLDLDPHMGRAYLDPKGIHACLANLLSNAVDSCLSDSKKEGHQVTFRTRRNKEESITFEVEDNGTGIRGEVKEKLFTSICSTKGTGGTGLGLLVTHKIIHEHGGDISLESEAGRGSLFRITLPQDIPDLPSAEQTKARET
jgi:PAS domain S-box-containing protein